MNCNLGIVQAAAVGNGYFVGLDITRDSGPNTGQPLFNLTNVSNFFVMGCSFIGGPSGGSKQDTAFLFKSTFNSSGNMIGRLYLPGHGNNHQHRHVQRYGRLDDLCY